MKTGHEEVPISRDSLSGEMAAKAGMGVPLDLKDAILQPVASWGDRNPHGAD
jgi:hypothetical protein